MSILTSSYFVGEYKIPYISGNSELDTANLADLNRIITIREEEYLTKLLGSTLYDDFIANQSTYQELKDKLYDSSNKISPVTGYCFYWWKRQTAVSETGHGSTESKHENSSNMGGGLVMAQAYNTAIRKGIELINWILDNEDDYPDFDPDLNFFKPINTFNI